MKPALAQVKIQTYRSFKKHSFRCHENLIPVALDNHNGLISVSRKLNHVAMMHSVTLER